MIGRWSSKSADNEQVEAKGFDAFDLRLGDLMRGERATLGKSLLDVQRELRIKASYIAAIENADPEAFDTPGFILSLIGLFLLGRSFAGVGLAISAMTRSPTLAAGATFFLLLLAWVLASAGGGTGLLAQILPEISPLTRLENFAIGRFVVADLLFFLVVMIASFVLATRAVDAHRWQG